MENLPQNTDTSNQLPDLQKTEKEMIWEKNHEQIKEVILSYLLGDGSMPSKAIIAKKTGLSRETIYKHIRAFAESTAYQNEVDSFELMTGKVMAQVTRAAIKGNIKAAKLFLDSTKKLRNQAADKEVTQQNNFVQINKTIINQQIIQQLKPEQLKLIEEIIVQQTEEKHG
jgi:hypothetical protein